MGYAGGRKNDPAYYSLGDHSEAIQIDYDPEKVSYEELLRVFWDSHDPGSQSRSRQYRNILFYHDQEQKELALKSRERLEAKNGYKVATDIVPFESFHQAEDYHQKHALQSYPGLMKEFRAMYPVFKDFVNSTAAARVNGFLAGYGSCETLRGRLTGSASPRSHQALSLKPSAARQFALLSVLSRGNRRNLIHLQVNENGMTKLSHSLSCDQIVIFS